MICKRTQTVKFWDSYAKWCGLWMEHTGYHHRIIETLTAMVERGWRVLDIGAGNGMLALPLYAMGCDITVLEPFIGMRMLLWHEAYKRGFESIQVDKRRWEDVSLDDYRNLDLIIAYNSLTSTGFQNALEKVFHKAAARISIS